MNLKRPLFGRITIGTTRSTLGKAEVSTMFVRAVEQMRKSRNDDGVVLIELSFAPLPDTTKLDRVTMLEQEFANNITSDPDAESPFPGITIGRVTEVMESAEYLAYEALCDPEHRAGVSQDHIDLVRQRYHDRFPDCFEHFPKWIDSQSV